MTSEKKRTPKLAEIEKELIELESQLDSAIPNTLWITDLHGEGARFISILKGRFGMLYQICREALPKNISAEKINYITHIIRRKKMPKEKKFNMDIQDVLSSLTAILRYKIQNANTEFTFSSSNPYARIIGKLLNHQTIPHIFYENDYFAERLLNEIAKLIIRYSLDHLIVLGDIFDRGGQPDKIIRILMSKKFEKHLSLILGNHDILWMGACAGNQSLVAEAMRITCRYDHLELIDKLGLNLDKLAHFAMKMYPAEKITGKFKAKTAKAKSMEKALAIIQFKLEEVCIKENPDFQMQSRLQLEHLLQLKNNHPDQLLDNHFPTIDQDNPTKLTEEEIEVIDDLTDQFKHNKKLKRLIRFFFDKGMMYHLHNSILNIHALVPSTEHGNFEECMGYKGKALFDFFQSVFDRVKENFIADKKQNKRDLAFIFYLWCGPKSPLFGKNAMKTLERYFYKDEETHKEITLHWKKNINSEKFKRLMQKEFHCEHVVYGHVPVDVSKGQKIASNNGFAINIDGGFARQYYDRGHALVRTPYQLYGIILPTPKEVTLAQQENQSAMIKIELIRDYPYQVKIKDTQKGKRLNEQKNALLEQVDQLKNKQKSVEPKSIANR